MHQPSGGLIFLKKTSSKKNEALKSSKDQLLLTCFLKSTAEDSQKGEDSSSSVLSMQTCQCLISTFLTPLVSIFSAYYSDEKVIREIYLSTEESESAIREADLRDFLEVI